MSVSPKGEDARGLYGLVKLLGRPFFPASAEEMRTPNEHNVLPKEPSISIHYPEVKGQLKAGPWPCLETDGRLAQLVRARS